MQTHTYPWQEECLRRWFENGGRGIINAAAGAGKTLLALAAAERLRQDRPGLQTYIVVPKTFLLAQWVRALQTELGIKRGDIGCVSGKRKERLGRAFTVYVVNSARYGLARSIASDLNALRPVLLIADECHHYGTAENARIFGFIGFMPANAPYYSLGLSATPYSAHFKTVLVPALGGEIYRFGFGDALREGILNPFTVFNIALPFCPSERREYDAYSESLRFTLRQLKKRYPSLRGTRGGLFFAQLNALSLSPDTEGARLAQTVQRLLYGRKNVLYRARERIACVKALVARIPADARIILFAERIETAKTLFLALKNRTKGGVGLYHSGMDENARTAALCRFANGESRVLISCKALDEGLNIPETDVGILVSATNSERQRIQRMGRVLRKKSGVEARLYYLYVENSVEEMRLLPGLSEDTDGVPVIDLTYREDEGFASPCYDPLAAEAASCARERGWTPAALHELERNLDLGRVACDWLLSEAQCQKRLTHAKTRAARNYFVTMRLLARIRRQQEEP